MMPLAILGAGIQKQYASLGMTTPNIGGHVHNIDHLAFRIAQVMSVAHFASWCQYSLPLGVPSLATICSALHGQTKSIPSPTTSCLFRKQSSGQVFIFGRVLTPCQLSRAGLGGPRRQDVRVGAHSVPPMLWKRSAIASLIALVVRAFGNSMQSFSRILMMP